MDQAGPEISIITPCYNEQESITLFHEKTTQVLDNLGVDYEILFIDDGSTDRTARLIETLTKTNPRVRGIVFSRNFGKEAALTAGIDYALGQAVIPMDVDLQDPPELLGQMIDAWRDGADVVLAKRSDRSSDTLFKRSTANIFYTLHNSIADIRIPHNVGDFRLMDRKVVDALKQLPERQRFMKGIFTWVGYETVVVEYKRPPRAAGETRLPLLKLINLAIEGFTSFSTVPLKLFTILGFLGTLLTMLYTIFVILRVLFVGTDVPGYPSLFVAVCFFGSINLLGLGVLGEYLGRIYMEVKQRPTYLVRNEIGTKQKR